MISKQLTAHSFYHTCRYVLDKSGAEVLKAVGVRDYDYQKMAEDFQMQLQLRPEKSRACLHSVISFYPGEKPDDQTLIEIAEKYLTRLEVTDTQYAITKHTDKAHLHLHIIANMVNNNGRGINESWIGLRGKRIAQALTLEYGLTPAIQKNMEEIKQENLSKQEAVKYQIYMGITKALQTSKDMNELVYRLKEEGIQTHFKYKGKTEEKQGISFEYNGIILKGSAIDRKYSLRGLENSLHKHQGLDARGIVLKEKLVLEKGPDTFKEDKVIEDLKELTMQLLKPEYDPNSNEFEKELLKRKRRQQSHGL
jgi:hypothetical protein